jgi:hypothetical protein
LEVPSLVKSYKRPRGLQAEVHQSMSRSKVQASRAI